MEPKNKKRINAENGLTITNLLCSTGYLPPRNEKDLERFDRLYKGQTFELESYCIDSDAIFDSVITSDTNKHCSIKKMPLRIDQIQLKAAHSIKGKRK